MLTDHIDDQETDDGFNAYNCSCGAYRKTLAEVLRMSWLQDLMWRWRVSRHMCHRGKGLV